MKTLLFAVLLLLAALPSQCQSPDENTEGVKRALLDYVEGFYEGDTTKLVRSVLPEVKKYGYWKEEKSGQYAGEAMSYQEMMDYANGVKKKKKFPPATAPKEVNVFEIQDQTACGKVTAWWGTDYILLGKYDGRWKIVHVLWQGPLKN
jgi:hypothetical protein